MHSKDEKLNHYFVAHPQSEMRFGIIRTHFRGKWFEFLTASGVFSKKRVDLGTRLLIESMVLPEEGCVLDIGCGYGAVGIVAAAFNPDLHVVLIDVNERATWLAEQNVKVNNVTNAEVRRGHLYEPIKTMVFNCVLSNPPVSAGMETVKLIITEAPKIMASNAYFQMVVKSKVGGYRLQKIFEDTFGNVSILERKSGYRVLISKKQ